MRVYLILLGKELRAIFLSPIAYIVLALVMVLNGLSFYASVKILSKAPSDGSLVTWTFNSLWFFISYFAVFPLITMRLFAEERKLGTLETLLTAPVRAIQLILSKYSAALIFYCTIWMTSFANFLIFQWATKASAELPAGPLLGSYAIVILMGMLNIAFGCLASSLTKNQIVAAILSFTMILVHFLLGFFVIYLSDQSQFQFAELTAYFASIEHIRTFTAGLIDSRAIVYYVSFTIFVLAITHQVLEFRRWKT